MYRNSPSLFRTVPSPTLYGLPFQKIGGSLLSHERVKLRTSNLARTISMPMKNSGEKEAWAYPGTAQFFGVPAIIAGMGKATDFKFGQYSQKVHPNKSPLKF